MGTLRGGPRRIETEASKTCGGSAATHGCGVEARCSRSRFSWRRCWRSWRRARRGGRRAVETAAVAAPAALPRPGHRSLLDGFARRRRSGVADLVERRLHGRGRRRRADRHGRLAGRGPRRRRARSSTARTSRSSRRPRACRTSTRTGTARSWPGSSPAATPALDRAVRDAPASAYRGIAPDARIVSVKVGVADGGADVTQVIAAIDWVVQHRDGHGDEHPRDQPLLRHELDCSGTWPIRSPYAAEQAWMKGIVVVVAGPVTRGYQLRVTGAPGLCPIRRTTRTCSRPAATTRRGRRPSTDDIVGDYSASSTGCSASTSARTPTSSRPGSHVQGLRVPNGFHRSEAIPRATRDALFPRLGHVRGGCDHLRR